MSVIRDEYVLETGQAVSSLDRMIQKEEQLTAVFERNNEVIENVPRSLDDRIARAAERTNMLRDISQQGADASARLSSELYAAAKAAHQEVEAENRATRETALLAQEHRLAAENVEKQDRTSNRLAVTLGMVARGAKSAATSLLGFNRVHNPLDGLVGRMTRMVALMFSTRRLLRYMKEAAERAPESIGRSYDRLKTGIQDGFARVMVSALGGMQRGVDKLNDSLNSPAGQRFFRGLEQAAEIAGGTLGRLFEIAGAVIEWIGEHSEQAFTVAGIAAAFFGAQMLIAAAGTLATATPMLLLIGLIAALVTGLNVAGVTSEQIFEKIGQGAGWLYALGYNLVADAHNLFATFAEFFATVFDDPVASVARLFFGLVDTIIGVVETAAKAIDALTGSNLANAVSGVRSDLQKWVDGQFGAKKIQLDRMEKIDPGSVMENWGEKASRLPGMFDPDALGQRLAPSIKSIDANTSAIRRAVDLTKEDIKSLVDVAERRYVNQVNLTNTTPQITIYGQNTGRTDEDRQALADAIQVVLAEQTASGGYVSTAMP